MKSGSEYDIPLEVDEYVYCDNCDCEMPVWGDKTCDVCGDFLG